jgi:hypothetical protein
MDCACKEYWRSIDTHYMCSNYSNRKFISTVDPISFETHHFNDDIVIFAPFNVIKQIFNSLFQTGYFTVWIEHRRIGVQLFAKKKENTERPLVSKQANKFNQNKYPYPQIRRCENIKMTANKILTVTITLPPSLCVMGDRKGIVCATAVCDVQYVILS